MTIITFHSTIVGRVEAEGIHHPQLQIILSGKVTQPGAPSSHLNGRVVAPSQSAVSTVESGTQDIMRTVSGPQDPKLQHIDSEGFLEQLEDNDDGIFYSAVGSSSSELDRKYSTDRDSFKSFDVREPLDSASVPQRVETDKGRDLERGRTLNQSPRAANPLERAESRDRKNDATIELDGRYISSKLSRKSLFEGCNDPYAIFDDALLEPRPHALIHGSVSEMIVAAGLSPQNDPRSLTGQCGFPGNLPYDIRTCETRAPLKGCLAKYQPLLHPSSMAEPSAIIDVLPTAGRTLHFEPNLSNCTTSTSNPTFRRDRVSIAAVLPLEIQHQIYLYLRPTDFDSARHVCRSWYASSFDRTLLEIMLRRGGWSSHIESGFSLDYFSKSQAGTNDERLLSKLLARECALGSDWKGNGLGFKDKATFFDHNRPSLKVQRTPLIRTSTTDFAVAGVYDPGAAKSDLAINFSVSTCGNILMVYQGCLVTIYELNRNKNEDWESGSLRPVTSVVCPKRILACSMDTSSHRYSIAILLDRRIGFVYDVSGFSKSHRRPRFSSQSNPVSRGGSSLQSTYFRTPITQNSLHPSTDNTSTAPVTPTNIVHPPRSTRIPLQDATLVDGELREYQPCQMRPTIIFRNTYPIEPHSYQSTKSAEPPNPSIYALCNADDPRSVALCPQRRCVAFGCSSGIELHWVDALTGRDLSRWFPLNVPSDYLYFLPPRAGIDNAKKLRLISSARHPSEWSDISKRFTGRISRPDPGNRGSSQPWDARARRHGSDWVALSTMIANCPGADSSDHYRAVPLSDGYHVLFIDPLSGMLCLGSDAPMGGPNKLRRKIWFVGQKGEGPPVSYTGGSDLRWGVRVVAAYGHGLEQTIWLFSVPVDILAASLMELGVPFAGISSPIGASNREWMDWRAEDCIERGQSLSKEPASRNKRLWPVHIRGQEIGKCRGLIDLALDSGPEMTIWAFGREAVAHTWQIDDGNFDGTVRKRFVIRDGTIREGDDDGNTDMKDEPPFQAEGLPSSGPFMPQTLSGGAFDDQTSTNGWLPGRSWGVDADGDVIMSGVS